MENIVRVSLWFGMLRRPSRDSVGGARGPEPRGSTARCHVVGRSIVNSLPLLKQMFGYDWQYGKCHIVRLYIGMYVRCQGLPYKSVRGVSVCPWTSRTGGRCTACKAFQVATKAVWIRTILPQSFLFRVTQCNLSKVARATLRYQRHQRPDRPSRTEQKESNISRHIFPLTYLIR